MGQGLGKPRLGIGWAYMGWRLGEGTVLVWGFHRLESRDLGKHATLGIGEHMYVWGIWIKEHMFGMTCGVWEDVMFGKTCGVWEDVGFRKTCRFWDYGIHGLGMGLG